MITVTLPSQLEYLSDRLFRDSTIKDIVIPETVTRIGDSCFLNCIIENGFELPRCLLEMGSHAFAYRRRKLTGKAQKLIIPAGLSIIQNSCFYYRNITELVIPKSIKIIGKEAFTGCPLTKVNLPDSILEMGWSCFAFCKSLKSCTVPSSIIDLIISNNIFRESPLSKFSTRKLNNNKSELFI